MSTDSDAAPRESFDVRIWLDPVCPFSWNTARWLDAITTRSGVRVDWRLMNLAVLNEGKELSPALQARMRDSRQVGRLMAGVQRDLGQRGVHAAYFAFGRLYFDESLPVDAELADRVLGAVAPLRTTRESLSDTSLDEVIRQSHEEGQRALGDVGGSPLVQVQGRTFFGPVLTEVPDEDGGQVLFDAVIGLARVPEFAQLQRPRPAH